MRRGVIAIVIPIAAGYVNPARGQVSATTLVVDLKTSSSNQVDTSDLSKWGTNPKSTPGKIAQGMGVGCAGVPVVVYGDIVSVNEDPARGTYAGRGLSIRLSPTLTAGVNAIAHISANSLRDETYYILQSDGVTPIGTIMVNRLNGSVSPRPPGPPVGEQNFTIMGYRRIPWRARSKGQRKRRRHPFGLLARQRGEAGYGRRDL